MCFYSKELPVNSWWQPQYTGEWTPKGVESDMSILAQRKLKAEKKDGPDGNQAFLDALPPSFLAFDTDGRVIRMDVSAGRLNHRLQWVDFLQDIGTGIQIGLDHDITHFHRTSDPGHGSLHTGSKWIFYSIDNEDDPTMGV